MPDSILQRVSSFHLEDLSIVALTTTAAQVDPLLHPDLDDARRGRLRARLKQIGRYDWPSNRMEDPHLRRGYTLRQCLRLISVLLLIDAHLAPSHAVTVARNNEADILRAIAPRLSVGDGRPSADPGDLLAVVALGELVDLVAEDKWRATGSPRLRHLRRSDLSLLWSAEAGLAGPGQRLIVDIGLASAAVWHWLLERDLMTPPAITQMYGEL